MRLAVLPLCKGDNFPALFVAHPDSIRPLLLFTVVSECMEDRGFKPHLLFAQDRIAYAQLNSARAKISVGICAKDDFVPQGVRGRIHHKGKRSIHGAILKTAALPYWHPIFRKRKRGVGRKETHGLLVLKKTGLKFNIIASGLRKPLIPLLSRGCLAP